MKRETFWEVEWYGEPPLDENGDSDWDRAEIYAKHFRTKAAAFKFAPKATKKSYTGEVIVSEWWKKPDPYSRLGYEVEYIGDSEYFQADDEAA